MQPKDIAQSHPNIFNARVKSQEKLKLLRAEMPEIEGVSVVVNGSLARGELTSQSDFDGYPLYSSGNKTQAEHLFEVIKQKAGLREFAAEGAFGTPTLADTMHQKIGGQGDDNKRFTLRMLLILESSVVGGRSVYDATIESIINRYISDDITDKQIGRFLLNDIIRFYRQMCVDFEFKTVEETKPWGIRYTKLIFSRKLIYYSGILMCAEMAGLPAAQKRSLLRSMIEQSPIERIMGVVGTDIIPALDEYEYFLGILDEDNYRIELGKVGIVRDTHTSLFKEVKSRGRKYSSHLVEIIRSKYAVSHPIREALIV